MACHEAGITVTLPKPMTSGSRSKGRITRSVHEHLVDEVQRHLDQDPEAMRRRRETVEHPFGTIKARMGATHFLMKRLKNVRTEMALHVLAYNLTRVMNILGPGSLIQAMRAWSGPFAPLSKPETTLRTSVNGKCAVLRPRS